MPVGRIDVFHPSTGNWTIYCERVRMYFTANNIRQDKQLSTFLSLVGDEMFELISNLTSPRPVATLNFDAVEQLVDQHLRPKTSVVAERYVFRKRAQLYKESINQYLCELKKLARKCDFGCALEENLRDQFVCGITSIDIRRRLFEEQNLTYDKAVQLATVLEAAGHEANAIKPPRAEYDWKKDDDRKKEAHQKWTKKFTGKKFDKKPALKTVSTALARPREKTFVKKANSGFKKPNTKKNEAVDENFLGTIQVNLQAPEI